MDPMQRTPPIAPAGPAGMPPVATIVPRQGWWSNYPQLGEEQAFTPQFGQVVTIAIEGISHRHPYLIEFAGRTLEGDRCVLVQHMSQTNILLIAIKAPFGREPRRIGFQAEPPSNRLAAQVHRD